MKVLSTTRFLIATGIVLLLGACDSDSTTGNTSGNSLTPPTPGGGIDRLGVSVGTIKGFGSIIVNGVRFETSTARFDVDDDSTSSSQSDLSVGDVVTVTFDESNPTNALTVVSDEAVEGPINTINNAAGELVVAGQTVLINVDTTFDNSSGVQSLASLQTGDFVEVSGFFDASGAIRATRIERKPTQSETEVHGVVTAKTADTFMINNLPVNYTNIPAIIDDNFQNGAFDNGDFVEVKGTLYSGNTLLATKIEPDGLGAGQGGANAVSTADFSRAEVEGLITRFGSATDFDVAGIPVRTSVSTVFEGGAAASLALNVKVEVEGPFSNGVLNASKVDIRRGNNFRVAALVDSIDPSASTVTLLGVDVRIDNRTSLEDKSDADLNGFSVGNIGVGDYLEVRGGVDTGSADLLAQSIEREDIPDVPGEDTELRGTVESVNRPLLILLGVTVDTSSARFQNISDSPISADDFFSSVQIGDLVDVEGFQTGESTISAEEVEFED